MEPAVERLSLKELEDAAAQYDAAVEADPEVDPFCTRSAWVFSYHRAFAAHRPVCALRADASYVVLAERFIPGVGLGLEPLEAMWGFASPLVGPHAVELLAHLGAAPLLLLGIPADGARLEALGRMLGRTHRLRPFDVVPRFVASLEGGLDGFLSRRSTAFRRNLRAAERRAAARGIEMERVVPASAADAHALYARVLAVEPRSWKAQTEAPVHQGSMAAFYAEMLPRLAEQKGLRAVIARCAGEDVGYVYGGLIGGRFRGLQFSFADSLREVGLGNLLQLAMIRWLCDDGARCYDLGSRSAYKRRWAETGLVTLSLVALPLRAGSLLDRTR
jgi:CelD/BcsL family acetyltransferase involved in cellulose biosynthesis